MFVLVKSTITNEYHTIYRRDIQSFLRLKDFFGNDEFNFEVIDDVNKIKQILDTEFVSKGRGGEYNEDLPSVTKIAYTLFPLHINSDKFLIRWWNNTPLKEQEGDKEHILQKGTWCHKILELWITDKESRQKDKPLIEQLRILNKTKKPSKKVLKQIDDKILSDIRRYIQLAYKDEEIIAKIPNIEEYKEELEFLAIKCLPEFIKKELIFADLVYSEIFLCIDNCIQGSVDLCCYDKNAFSIWDFKTTSSVDKKTGKPKFKSNSIDQLAPYARQLYIYNELLKRSEMTHLYDGSIPNFYIIQLHLISGQYKKFTIPQGLVESQGKTVEKVLKWYWDVRNGVITNDNINAGVEEFDELEIICL